MEPLTVCDVLEVLGKNGIELMFCDACWPNVFSQKRSNEREMNAIPELNG